MRTSASGVQTPETFVSVDPGTSTRAGALEVAILICVHPRERPILLISQSPVNRPEAPAAGLSVIGRCERLVPTASARARLRGLPEIVVHVANNEPVSLQERRCHRRANSRGTVDEQLFSTGDVVQVIK